MTAVDYVTVQDCEIICSELQLMCDEYSLKISCKTNITQSKSLSKSKRGRVVQHFDYLGFNVF